VRKGGEKNMIRHISSQKFSALNFNFGAKILTALFIFYLIVLITLLYLFGPFYLVTTPLHSLIGSITIFAEAAVGFRASRIFGGRKNFTGSLLLYYSIALVAQAISWDFWALNARGEIPTGTAIIVLGSGAILGQIISSFAILKSVRAIVVKIDKRIIMLILIALCSSVIFSIVIAIYETSLQERIVWSGIWSATFFIQLAGALILMALLGKWYMAKPIVYIALAYMSLSLATAIVTTFWILGILPPANYWTALSIVEVLSFFTMGIAMSQVMPARRVIGSLGTPSQGKQ
jgi:hypothetical protein